MALPVLVLGFLIGWLVEWIIDNQYRRMRELGQSRPVFAQGTPSGGEIAELVRTVENVLSEHEEQVNHLQTELTQQGSRFDQLKAQFDHYVVTHPDDLTVIKGIGRIYQWKLRDAGITAYEQLASTTAEHVREMLQVKRWQRIDPESWIEQAKALARQD